jgi:endonuclease G, mitochondrial
MNLRSFLLGFATSRELSRNSSREKTSREIKTTLFMSLQSSNIQPSLMHRKPAFGCWLLEVFHAGLTAAAHTYRPGKLLRLAFAGLVASGLVVSSAHAALGVTNQMQLGNPTGATNDPSNHQHYLIQRTVETIDYNDQLGEPNWASWDLTATDIGSSGRSPSFFTDTTLPSGFYQVSPNDYSGSGYDRGHMCPSADRTDNDADNALVFYMSNIIPQDPANNQGVWANFEDYCRTLAQNDGDEVLIICGPSGFDGGRITPSLAVAIPNYTWKIAVVVPPGAGTALSRITAMTRVICLKIPNSNGVSTAWQNYITSAAQIEVDTGFTFFTALSPEIASVLRNEVDGQNSPAPVITGFSPPSGSVNSSVVITGTNFIAVSAVTFGDTPARSFVVNGTGQITAVVATNSTDGPISVTTSAGTAVSTNSFTVLGSIVDLAVGKSHTGNFTQGDTADTYTITVSNLGNVTSSGTVTVTDALPAGLTIASMSGVGWTTDPGGLTCSRSDALPAGASFPPITVTVSVATNAPAGVTNVASVSGGGDDNADNNTAGDPTTVLVSSPLGEVVTLLAWDVSGLPGGANNFGPSPYAPTAIDSHLASSGWVRGSGVGTTGGSGAVRAWGGNAWTASSATNAVIANEFATCTATVGSGYTVSYTAISRFDYRRSSTGPGVGVLQYQVGSGPFTDVVALSYPVNTSGGASLNPINLSGIADLQNVGAGTNVTFRIVNYSGGSAGTWYIFDVAGTTAPDFAIDGSISPVVVLAPIESWRQQWFGTTNNTGTAADDYVATSDGMPNLLKYALGLDPLVPTNSPIVGDISTGYLRLTTPRNPDATDVIFTVEAANTVTGPWSSNGIVVDVDTPSLLRAHDSLPVGSEGSRVMRLRVTRP